MLFSRVVFENGTSRTHGHYVASGQRVPEDLHLGNRQYLVHRAFKYRPGQSPYYVSDDDLPFVMSAGGAFSTHQTESAVSLG